LSVSDSHNKVGGINTNPIPQSRRKAMVSADLDPNKRYLSCSVVKGTAFTDFINISDEQLSISVSFMKQRFATSIRPASTDPIFNENFCFELTDEKNSRLDATQLLQVSAPLHVTILKHSTGQKPKVLGTKNIDWRAILACNSIEINATVQPVN
jgi:hypothetical protein